MRRVGDLTIAPVIDGTATADARSILAKPDSTGDPWAPHADLLDEDGRIEMTMGGYLVTSGDRRVLVDAGLGTIDSGDWHGGAMLDSLAALGLAPSDVTDVLLTHLHFDHVGWVSQQGEIVFPNATYRCHVEDWRYFVERPGADEGAVRKLRPIEPRLEPFDTDHSVAPGVDVRHVPGHTPGSVLVVVSDGDERAMLIGDVAHCPIELTEDDWDAAFDVDPAMARAAREALARELEGTGVPIGAAHFPGLEFGRLLVGEAGARSWVFDGG